MDSNDFDTVARSFISPGTRRGVLLRLLAGSVLGGLVTVDTPSTEAKKGGNGKGKGKANGKNRSKRKGQEDEPGEQGEKLGTTKITICHKGQTITVAEPAWKGHEKHGDSMGPCNPCADLDEGATCDTESGGVGACCDGECTSLGTLQNCAACGDVCQAGTDTCSDLGSGGDPESGCCAAIYSVCDPSEPDRCCNDSSCIGNNAVGEPVCCGVGGVSPCSIGTECCSLLCDVIGGLCV